MTEELIDPDAESDVRYSWDEDFQRHVISMLLSDRQFLLHGMNLVKSSYFTNKAHSKACEILFRYFEKYKHPPDRSTLIQEVKDELKGNKALTYYLSEITALYDYFQPGLDTREYLTDKIAYFAKIQALKSAFNKSLEQINKNPENDDSWNKVYDMLHKAMIVDRNFDVGMYYVKETPERYEQMNEEEENGDVFSLGYESVDRELKGGGYRRGQSIAVMADSGVGKCLNICTPILMFDGTIKMVQDIKVGDVVMGDDSTPRNVLSTHTGIDDMYDIIPVKGDKYTTNSRHTLVLKSASKFIDKKNNCINPRYWTSPYHAGNGIFEIEVKDYLNQSLMFKSCMKGFRTGVNWEFKEVRIDPYILGVWLGDGTSTCSDITTEDYEVVNSLWHEANNRESDLNEKYAKGKAFTYSMTGGNKLTTDLRLYQLLKNKHVPMDYKINDRKTRLEILAGLIDSDGSKSNNCFDFVNKNETLARDVEFLARSLGFAAYTKPCWKCATNTELKLKRKYWRVTISGNTHEIPVRIPRKKCKPRNQIKDVLSTGITVKHVGKDRYYGFETDGNKRFLLGDFTVVHNSVMLACITAHNALRGKKCLYISCENSESEIADRLDSILTGAPIRSLYAHKTEIFDKLEGKISIGSKDDGQPVYFNPEEDLIIIKKFPQKSADVNTVRAYLTQLKYRGFSPDFVVVDYVGEMKDYAGMKTYESREKVMDELTGLADEEGFFLATAIQPNRDGKEAQAGSGHLGQANIADSFGQMRPLFGCLTLNQNEREAKMNCGRGWVEKQRNGRKYYQFYLSFDHETLKITEISQQTYKDRMSSQTDQVVSEIEIDTIKQIEKKNDNMSTTVDKVAKSFKPKEGNND